MFNTDTRGTLTLTITRRQLISLLTLPTLTQHLASTPNPTQPENTTQTNPPFTTHNPEIQYYPHLGVHTQLSIKNNDATNIKIKCEAYTQNTLLTKKDNWVTIPEKTTQRIEIHNNEIWTFRNNIDSINKFIIKGKIPDTGFKELHTLTRTKENEQKFTEQHSNQPSNATQNSTQTKPEISVNNTETTGVIETNTTEKKRNKSNKKN